MKRLAVLVLTLTISACGDSRNGSLAPTSPSSQSLSVAGTWTGFATEETAPVVGCTSGTARVTFAQTGAAVSGAWTITYANRACDGSGTLTGSVSGTTLTATLSPSVPTQCPIRIIVAQSSNTFLRGTYAAFSCSVASGGAVLLQKS